MRVLELYSGIGGMHYAFQESGAKGTIVASVDINPVSNEEVTSESMTKRTKQDEEDEEDEAGRGGRRG
ncbi:tRNA (cytosine(38)-C(5))-methyltransferase isoform X2 [Orussus abietinus]|uniref:tRNA (cytosine(38)-C(5))-methyltransferase isoform X2 n=1 Tax=Orussus abietinus TaxID=222816 RepID=UPI000626DE96|nr:tRNA (cytosine(38)-C(5))-methyltransferase isoform X2 [Orussus abietinus]